MRSRLPEANLNHRRVERKQLLVNVLVCHFDESFAYPVNGAKYFTGKFSC